MKNLSRVEIGYNTEVFDDIEGKNILGEFAEFGIKNINHISTAKVFTFADLTPAQTELIKNKLLLEPLWLRQKESSYKNGLLTIEIGLKPGVTNTERDSIIKAVQDLGIKELKIQTSKAYTFYGKIEKGKIKKIADKILFNKTVERILADPASIFKSRSPQKLKVESIPIRNLSLKKLLDLSHQRLLFLSKEELIKIKRHFQKLYRDPTDCEIEILAQTWSEHNFHKTFKAKIRIGKKIKNSFIERIKKTTDIINHKDAMVVFSDNAGIVSFDKKYAISAKTETHNSPSAIEPYGGSATGVGGVFRDIAGSGLGAKNIAALDIFCFGYPNMPYKQVLPGCLHPKRIMQKCIQGVKDYGNRMGIPTVNGSLSFASKYRAKPVVLVGAVGVLPKKYVLKKNLHKGDLIVTVGGKTGRDGIHGATFSSGEMTKKTEMDAQSAVQIGNPIEEKRMFDALLVARDKNLLKFITDCGGGGYSSAIGELAKDVGLKIDLSQIPLKYEGLMPWEIWLSESQERMVIVIDRKNWPKFKNICQMFNTKSSIIGSITGDKKLKLFYHDEIVADLSMSFLHGGVPQKILKAKFPKKSGKKQKKHKTNFVLKSVVAKILSHPNVASKEEIVRRYDHEVQGRLILKPFIGKNLDAPSDSSIIKPVFDSYKGVAIAHGLNTRVSQIDPFWGGIYAVDECLRNLVVSGVDPSKIFLLDNFIFPKPDNPYVLGDLDYAVDGICLAAKLFKAPFISGKDSLSGTYVNGKQRIDVPPTICISGVGIVPDIRKSISSDFKKDGNLIVLFGEVNEKLSGSIFDEIYKFKGDKIPKFNLKKALRLYNFFYNLLKKDLIFSAHDVSEGGLFVSLVEMCFGNNFGAKLNIPAGLKDASSFLFSESGGRIVAEIEEKNLTKIKKLARGINIKVLGTISLDGRITINSGEKTWYKENITTLKNIWKSTFQKYF